MKGTARMLRVAFALLVTANAYATSLEYRGTLATCSTACDSLHVLSFPSVPGAADFASVVFLFGPNFSECDAGAVCS